MTDEEVICTWMEDCDPRKQVTVDIDGLSWWAARYQDGHWEFRPVLLTLDALHVVEARLTGKGTIEDRGQWHIYSSELIRLTNGPEELYLLKNVIHADAPTRIKALAAVLRSEVERG